MCILFVFEHYIEILIISFYSRFVQTLLVDETFKYSNTRLMKTWLFIARTFPRRKDYYISLTLPHLGVWPKHRSVFTMSCVVAFFMFNDMNWEVVLGFDISGIVGHSYLSVFFCFIKIWLIDIACYIADAARIFIIRTFLGW
jgi:hypothetical protein